MGTKVALVGDLTTTGGIIISGVPNVFNNEQEIAVLGSLVTCPKCNTTGSIIEGENTFIINDKPAALDGHIVSCGCPFGSNKVIATKGNTFAHKTHFSDNIDKATLRNNINSLPNHKAPLSSIQKIFKKQNNVCSIEDLKHFNYPKWSEMDFILWKVSPLGGNSYLYNYKDSFIIYHKDYIKHTAFVYNIPVVLLAGVARAEAGGMPDELKPQLVLPIRKMISKLPDAIQNKLYKGFTQPPDKTSIGVIAMQIKVASKTLGSPENDLTDDQLDDLANCLSQDKFNINIVAQHLRDLILYDYPDIEDTSLLTDEQIIVTGSRYNRGIERKLEDFISSIHAKQGERIREYSSYGRSIIKHREHIIELLR